MWMRLRAGVSRLFFVLTRRRLDEDTRLEIEAHLDLLTERYLRQGMSADDAYMAARRRSEIASPSSSGSRPESACSASADRRGRSR